jgi:hypothetical protein
MADKSWKISGEYMESCNCDQLCPCIFTNPQGPVTYDDCRPVLIFRIDEGECDGVEALLKKFTFLYVALVLLSTPSAADQLLAKHEGVGIRNTPRRAGLFSRRCVPGGR